MSIILSHYQVKPLLQAHTEGRPSLPISPDLGLSQVEVELLDEGAKFPTGERLDWEAAREIVKADVACFALEEDQVRKIQIFSESTGRFYSLMPTSGAPTMLLSGIPMHRIKGIDPHQDTLLKIAAIKPAVGSILDTAMGLGYTAIQAALTAESVTTIELDPAVPELAAQNPWSRALFTNPKITRLVGDSFELVEGFAEASFTRIVHDPPMFQLAGELFSGDFYRQLYRVLRTNGRLFHYIGDLNSPSGARTAKGAARRLEGAGFEHVKYDHRAFGITAVKSAR